MSLTSSVVNDVILAVSPLGRVVKAFPVRFKLVTFVRYFRPVVGRVVRRLYDRSRMVKFL